MDEKDHFGQKIRDLEQAREDQWARDEDQKLLAKLRQRQAVELHCPRCSAKLAERVVGGIAIMTCPHGHGGWLDHETTELHCPRCGAKLTRHLVNGVATLACPLNHGGWLDHESLQHLHKH